MMQHRLSRSVRDVLFDALVLLLALVFAAAVAAAKPTHVTRLRRAETMQATPDFSRPMRGSRSRKKSHSNKTEARTKREEARPALVSSRRHSHATETVADRRAELRADQEQAVMESRAELRRKSSRRGAVVVARDRDSERDAVKHEARGANAPAAAKVDLVSPKKMMADDSLRAPHMEDAAEMKTNVAAKSDGAYATGVSHPDGDEPTVTLIGGDAARAQQHDVTEALARAQGSAEGDGGIAAPAEDAGTPAVRPVQKAVANPTEMDALLKPSHAEMAQEAIAPRLPGLYSREGKLIMPAPLRGSREILVHQNEMADAAGLNRIRTDAQLDSMRAHHLLVNFSETAGLHVNPNLPVDRRCARPWTVQFAQETAKAFYARFHEPLEVNSAVRTVAYQKRLQRVNGNAAAVDGDGASPHLTGQALDFGKRGMSLTEIAWMRAYLLPLMQSGKLDVEEEFQQACFHISVYRSYVRGDKVAVGKGEVAENRD
jgi:hypothetical protein